MIRPLRKWHLQVWIVGTFLLPLGIISAIEARRPMSLSSINIEKQQLLPVLIQEKSWNSNVIQLRGINKKTVGQLVWVNKKPVPVVSFTIYLADGEVSSQALSRYVGRIESKGTYVFMLPTTNEYRFIFYDFINQKLIDSINFKL
jgi:hypothetical protein